MFAFESFRMPKVSRAYADARRKDIIQAAASCFAANGFRATQMRHVAKQAGLSTGALYRYFSGKAELRQAVFDWLRDQDAAVRRQLFDGEGSAIDRLESLPAHIVQLAESSEEQARRNFRDYGEAATVPFLEAALRDVLADTFDDFEALIREAQGAGDLRPDLDPRMTAVVLGTQVVGVRLALVFGGPLDGEALATTLQAMIAGLRQ